MPIITPETPMILTFRSGQQAVPFYLLTEVFPFLQS